MKKIASLLIVLAGIAWATMGIFVRFFTEYGFSSIQIVSIRLVSGALLMDIFFQIFGRKYFKTALSNIPLFAFLGVFSIFLMSVFYFKTITLASLSVAAILLYTAPIMVVIMSAIFFKEKLNPRKIVCLFVAFFGCILVTGINGKVTAEGIIFGILSGFSYALYSILGKLALKKAHPYTISIYAFNAAALAALCSCRIGGGVRILLSSPKPLLLWAVACGLITAVLPFLLYTTGLKYTPAGKAAIIAFAEPLCATLFGLLIFAEALSFWTFCGIVCIMLSIIILNLEPKSHRKTNSIHK